MPTSDPNPNHIPVLADQVFDLLAPKPGQSCLDCTVGRGGHASLIIPHLTPAGHYIGLDADPQNAQFALDRLKQLPEANNVKIATYHANFARAKQVLTEEKIEKVDLLLADLGFASNQMDNPERGLSFNAPGPLDMRLDPTLLQSAADLVNRLPQEELADLLYQYGDERFSRKIARKIVEKRKTSPITTTEELAAIPRQVYPRRAGGNRIDPATRTFQALRIAVNDELGVLKRLLSEIPRLLKTNGVAAIISFHSLEDRQVKHAFAELHRSGQARRLTKKPVVADQQESRNNPRSRSAKLRAIQWLGPPDA